MRSFRALVGFNYPGPGKPALGQAETQEDREGIRVEEGEILVFDTFEGLPALAHLVGECGPDCKVAEEKPDAPHGWGLTGGIVERLQQLVPADGAEGFQGIVSGPSSFKAGEGPVEEIVIAPAGMATVRVDLEVAKDGTARIAASPAPFHSKRGTVYHVSPDCSLGNNVEPENRVEGDGALPLCSECGRLTKGEGA